jgi:diguanylate cyclase (GGDEF)-like protein
LFVGVVPLPASGGAKEADVPRDALTGLANREALIARAASDAGGKRPARLALMFIDLDGFKRINDRCGHLAGDRVLRIVAERLKDSIRPGDLIVRYGGDEFVVLVEGVTRRRDLERLARRMGRAVRRPIVVDGHDVELSASIGIAQHKSRAPTIDALIANADREMYRVKFRRRDAQRSLSKSNADRG